MKDYTWSLSTRNQYGELIHSNVTDTKKGYRQGWYKTEQSARKALFGWISLLRIFGHTEIKWAIYHRENNGLRMIDKGEE